MGSPSHWVPYLLFGASAGAAKAMTPKPPAMPQLPDFSSLLAQAPSVAATSKDEQALRQRLNRKASAPFTPDPSILTSGIGLSSPATTQRKTLLGT